MVSAWAMRSRPATLGCGPRSRACTRGWKPTTRSSSRAPRRPSSAFSPPSLGPGDHAVVTWPGYQSLYEVARAAGAEVTLHELLEADGWALDVARLVGSFRPTTRVAVVNAPHNPTGMLPSVEEWRALGEACAGAGVRLVANEVYRFLEHDGRAPLPAGADLALTFVSIGVLSKSFALAGLRIGWLASRDRDLLARCASVKDYTTICARRPPRSSA